MRRADLRGYRRLVPRRQKEFPGRQKKLTKQRTNNVPVIASRNILRAERQPQRQIKTYAEIKHENYRNA